MKAPTLSARGRSSLLDRPLEESFGITSLLDSKEIPGDDVGLRFYFEVLGLEHLHYGLWTDSDPLTLDGLRRAQERYAERLLGLIPDGVSRVLDVGCGAGGTGQVLKNRGYEVEGLSPDASHGERFRAATGCPFHQARFQDFEPRSRFDLVLMSESSQYVPLDRIFSSVRRALEPGGWLLLSDYFVLEKDGSYIARSGHPLAAFRAALGSSGFAVEQEHDVTDRVAPSLDLACGLLDEYLVPSIRLAFLRGAQKHPLVTRALARFARKKLAKVERRLENLDSDLFRKKKRYLILRLRAPFSPDGPDG